MSELICNESLRIILERTFEKIDDKVSTDVWLSRYRASKSIPSNKITHVSLSGGKYRVPDSKHTEFLNVYVRNARNKQHIVEKPSDNYPVQLDIDLKYESPRDENFVLSKVNTFLSLFASAATRVFKNVDTDVYVCTKKREFTKNGIHMYFPDLVSRWQTQARVRNYILENSEGSLKELFETINSDENIYDAAMCRKNPNGLLLPWSSKVSKFTGIYRPTRRYHIQNTHISRLKLSTVPSQLIHFCSTRTNKKAIPILPFTKKQPSTPHVVPSKPVVAPCPASSNDIHESKSKNTDRLGIHKILVILKFIEPKVDRRKYYDH